MSGLGRTAPTYVRLLRLKHVRPSGLMCFLLLEGVVGLAVLLSLAELVNWWSVIVLPAIVAGLVKINDIVAGAYARSEMTMRFTTRRRSGSVRGTARVPASRRRVDLDVATEVLPRSEGLTRAERRRATNQRPFVRAADSRPPDLHRRPEH